ncbi:MAG: ABC transporter ATP-binding protein [Nocardioidaceae bacterium]
MSSPAIAPKAPTAEAVHLRVDGLSKTYAGQDHPAVDAATLAVNRGDLLALLGPSGCGKTTTLRMIAGLVEPSGGHVEVGGREITELPVHRRGIGMVFQSYALFPHLDVGRNVAFGLEMRKTPRSERQTRVGRALDLVRLGGYERRKVRELSGGQQQRVALARALAIAPELLLLDEPLSNLDAKLREAMRGEIREIQQRSGVTTVFVTHDQSEALALADTVVVMSDGRIEQVGTPQEIYDEPASAFVAGFIGRANMLNGTVVGSTDGYATVEVPRIGRIRARTRQAVSGAVTVMVRPHRLQVAPVVEPASSHADRTVLTATVRDLSYTGELVSYTLAAGDQTLKAESLTGPDGIHKAGEQVQVSWAGEDACVLPEHTPTTEEES